MMISIISSIHLSFGVSALSRAAPDLVLVVEVDRCLLAGSSSLSVDGRKRGCGSLRGYEMLFSLRARDKLRRFRNRLRLVLAVLAYSFNSHFGFAGDRISHGVRGLVKSLLFQSVDLVRLEDGFCGAHILLTILVSIAQHHSMARLSVVIRVRRSMLLE